MGFGKTRKVTSEPFSRCQKNPEQFIVMAIMEITIRPVELSDMPAMAALRGSEWQTEAFWVERISLYLNGQRTPRQGLAPRAAFVAIDGNELAGFVAGHLTRRLECDGELQWINVAPEHRGRGISDDLIARMGEWFIGQHARRICVNVAPENGPARKLYARCGARRLDDHWMIWEDARAMCKARS